MTTELDKSRDPSELSSRIFRYAHPPWNGRLVVYSNKIVLSYRLDNEPAEPPARRWTLEHSCDSLSDAYRLARAALQTSPDRLVRYGWRLTEHTPGGSGPMPLS